MSVKIDTIVRTVVLVLALANQILTALGYKVIPITDDQISEFVTLGITIVAAVWSWWKNNSFTPEAIEADQVLKELKEMKDKESE